MRQKYLSRLKNSACGSMALRVYLRIFQKSNKVTNEFESFIDSVIYTVAYSLSLMEFLLVYYNIEKNVGEIIFLNEAQNTIFHS